MEVRFSKYQGAGNDFIAIDNREGKVKLQDDDRKKMCDRHFGIGSDGLLEIRSSDKADFTLVYFNADGREGSLCGNGSRCAVAFAMKIGVRHKDTNSLHRTLPGCGNTPKKEESNNLQTNKDSTNPQPNEDRNTTENKNDGQNEQGSCEDKLKEDDIKLSFEAADGIHIGGVFESIREESNRCRYVYFVDMKDVKFDEIKIYDNNSMFLNNGSPHHVAFLPSSIEDVEVVKQGRKLRYELYGQEGCNINFVAKYSGCLKGQKNGSLRNEEVADTGENVGQLINEKPKTSVHSDDDSRRLGHENECANGVDKNNSVAIHENIDVEHLFVRTYERGVENETLACGTGCVAVAIADYIKREAEEIHQNSGNNCDVAARNTISVEGNLLTNSESISTNEQLARHAIGGRRNKSQLQERRIKMPGGRLLVMFRVNNFQEASCNKATVFSDITLSGPAEHVFDGVYTI